MTCLPGWVAWGPWLRPPGPSGSERRRGETGAGDDAVSTRIPAGGERRVAVHDELDRQVPGLGLLGPDQQRSGRIGPQVQLRCGHTDDDVFGAATQVGGHAAVDDD